MTYALRFVAAAAVVASVAAALLVDNSAGGPPRADAGLPAAFTVNTADDHLGHQFNDVLSLREAVLLATGDLNITDLSGGECAQVEPATFPDACETPYLVGAPYANSISFDPAVFPHDDPPQISAVAAFELHTFGTTVDATGAFVTIEGDPSFPCFSVNGSSNQLRALTITGCGDALALTSGAQNIVASNTLIANQQHAILITEQSTANTIEDNLIGTNSLDHDLGNALSGILIANSHSNTIARNRVANNGASITGSSGLSQDNNGLTILQGLGNDLEANEFDQNAGLAIDLAGDGVTQNDAGDTDVGPNRRQNFPVIASAIAQSPFRVAGTLDGAPGISHRLDFFENESCDPSGNGEGDRFLGSADIVTHDGPSDFLEFFDPKVSPGNFVTATATNLLNGDTSEISACFTITDPDATPTPTASATPTPTPSPTPTPGLIHGDIDCDGDVDSIDVLKLLTYLVGNPFPQPPGCPPIPDIADIDCDGDVDAADALQILRFIAGLAVNQAPGCPAIGDLI